MLWKRTAIATALLAMASGAVATEPLRTLTPGELRIGTYFVNPPFEYVADGKDVGFEVDLMDEVAQRLGLKPAFADTKWETILREMQDGLYDCIVGGITITAEREQILAWSAPYITTTLSLVVNSAKTAKQQIRVACARLKYARSKIFGVVLNKVNLQSPEYKYYKNYYFHYSNDVLEGNEDFAIPRPSTKEFS